MKSLSITSVLLLSLSAALAYPSSKVKRQLLQRRSWSAGSSDGSTGVITPQVFIISLFTPEAEVWYNIPEFNLLENNITVPGFSPILPDAHCTGDGLICQVVTGEGEINAANTINALATSSLFDLSETYFMIGGIAGVNPTCGTLGSVAFAKYAVQVGLEYEIDPRELPDNYTSGYFALGTTANNEYPVFLYGTEAFELNENLRDRAIALASQATLNDSDAAAAYRLEYPNAPANQPPSVVAGDAMTSDVFWHGELLAETFEDYFLLLTNGSGKYCMTAQEDNASLEAMVRAALFGLVDFSRIILMRTGANFDRPPPGETAAQQLFYINQGGFVLSTQNIYIAGIKVVTDIIANWGSLYQAGITPSNYIGDIFDSLNSTIPPDIGSPFFQTG